MKKVVFGIAIAAAVAAGGVTYATSAKNAIVKEKIDEGISNSTDIAEIKYQDISSSIFSDEIVVKGISVKPSFLNRFANTDSPTIITINSLAFSTDIESELPRHFNMSVQGLTMPPINERKAKRILGDFAETGLQMDMNMNYEFTSTDEFKLTFKPNIQNIGQLESRIHLKNMAKIYTIGQNAAKNSEGLSRKVHRELEKQIAEVDVETFYFKATNAGLMETITRALAERRNETIEESTAWMLESIERDIKRAKRRERHFEELFATEMAKFVQSPKALELEVKPDSDTKLTNMFNELDRGRIGGKDSGFKVSFKSL